MAGHHGGGREPIQLNRLVLNKAFCLMVVGVLWAGQGMPVTPRPGLSLRQFDASRSPEIDIVAEVEQGKELEAVEIQELRADQHSPVDSARRVSAASAKSLVDAAEYAYKKPVLNVVFAFAGKHSQLVRVLKEPGVAEALKKGAAGTQGRALQLFVADLLDENELHAVTSWEELGEAIEEQAGRIIKNQPRNVFQRLFAASPYTSIDSVAKRIHAHATKDAQARSAVAHVAVILWAGTRDTDKMDVFRPLFFQDNLAVVVAEASHCADLSAEQVRPFCEATRGKYVKARDIKLQGGKKDWAKIVSVALETARRRLEGKYLITGRTDNLEKTDMCWFQVGIPGTDIRQRVSCSRDADVVEKNRRIHAAAVEDKVARHVEQDEFGAAQALIPQVKAFGRDSARCEKLLFDKMRLKALDYVARGLHGRSFVLAKEIRTFGGETKPLLAELYAAMEKRAVENADRAAFDEAIGYVEEIKKCGGDPSGLKCTLAKKIEEHAVALAARTLNEQALAAFARLPRLDEDLASARERLSTIFSGQAVAAADKMDFAQALNTLALLRQIDAPVAPVQRDIAQRVERLAMTMAEKAEFSAALGQLAVLRKLEADVAKTQNAVVDAWCRYLMTQAEKGNMDAAEGGAGELEKNKLLSPDRLAVLREDLVFKAGVFFAGQDKSADRAIAYLAGWRTQAQKSCRYGKDAGRAVTAAREMARLLTGRPDRDTECAAEINEILRVDAEQAHDEKTRSVIGAWLARDHELHGLTVRFGLLNDWDAGAAALKKPEPAYAAALRIFVLATDPVAAATELKHRHGESLGREVPVPGYLALNRALVLSAPLQQVLKSAWQLNVAKDVIETVLNEALEGANTREVAYYREATALNGNVLAKQPIRMVGCQDNELGHAIRVSPAFLKRVYAAGKPALFEGGDERQRVCMLLFPLSGADRFLTVAFTDGTAAAVEAEIKEAKTQLADKTPEEIRAISLSIRDMRDAEIMTHFGVESLCRLIHAIGPDAFMSKAGSKGLQAFHEAIPAMIRGFVFFDGVTVADGAFVLQKERSVRIPQTVPDGVKAERPLTGGGYAIWEEPFFEIGLPVREPSGKKIAGFLRVGLKTIQR